MNANIVSVEDVTGGILFSYRCSSSLFFSLLKKAGSHYAGVTDKTEPGDTVESNLLPAASLSMLAVGQ